MKTVNYGTCSFLVAAEPTPGIPVHAVEIEGNLIQLDKPNENGWGLSAQGESEFIKTSTGIPIRMCNSLDSHECDYNSDNYSNIGYVAKTYSEDGWLKSRAVITNEAAAKQITDGTWMPFSKGSWSVSGLPSGGMSEEGILDNLIPTSIALVLPPNEPAYEGSSFEVVSAAVWSTAYINDLPDSAFAYVESCYGKTTDNKNARHLPYKDSKGKVDLPHLRNALARVNQIKPICDADVNNKSAIIERTQKKLESALKKQKSASTITNQIGDNMTETIESGDPAPALDGADAGTGTLNEPVATPVESEPTGIEVTMYDQEAVDKQIATALESQKVEYDAQMALMTPNTELETMFAAAKTEAIDATMDQISREKLTNEYIELVSASKVLSAPMMVDGKMDADKLSAKTEQVKQFTASVIQGMIDESKLMVAALPAGQTPFDAASVGSAAPGTGFDYAAVRDEYNTKLGLK